MDASLWSQRRPPSAEPVHRSLGSWALTARADLTSSRRDLHACVDASDQPPGTRTDDVDRLLLAYEELASNGLRHGSRPVEVTVFAGTTGWLVDVTDAAPDRPPVPAVDRDPATGGVGLYLAARLAAAHGWFVDHGRKHVWAWITLAPTG